jgi:hypothetical protein
MSLLSDEENYFCENGSCVYLGVVCNAKKALSTLLGISIEELKMQSRKTGFYLILISIFISFILVMSTNLNKYELGALIIWILPFINGLATIVIYFIITFIFKNSSIRIVALAICFLYNIYFGISVHFDMMNLPLLP